MTAPASSLAAEKAALRRRARSALEALSDAQRARGAAQVAEAVVAHLAPALERTNGPVALFASLPVELSTAPLDDRLRERRVARVFPITVGDDLRFHLAPDDVAGHALPAGAFRVPSPDPAWPEVELARCAAVIVPGLAFDRRGGRVGWGRGFYDRALAPALAAPPPPPEIVAIAFDEQLVDEVPMTEADVRVPALCTPALGVQRSVW